MMAAKMPTFFIPHGGGPCFFMDWTQMGGPADAWHQTEAFLRGLIATLPDRPTGIVVISAHWEEEAFTVSSAPAPKMIFDYNGFPEHTYRLAFPAPGDPTLAERVVSLLTDAGLPARSVADRGFDHGVFIPLLLVTPQADIPVVPLSLQRNLDPQEHLRAGQAIAALRDEGVLIIGSGMSFHNMQLFFRPGATRPSVIFDAWLTEAVEAEPGARWRALANWTLAPAARQSHPREEHLLPLMVAAGAGDAAAGVRSFADNVMMADISAFRFG